MSVSISSLSLCLLITPPPASPHPQRKSHTNISSNFTHDCLEVYAVQTQKIERSAFMVDEKYVSGLDENLCECCILSTIVQHIYLQEKKIKRCMYIHYPNESNKNCAENGVCQF